MAAETSTAVTAPVHPDYTLRLRDWQQCFDTYEGQRRVKDQGVLYLPATEGMIEDGYGSANTKAKGNLNYTSYLQRAVFHELHKDAVDTYIGLLHKKPSTIELPKELESMRNSATADNESLDMLERRISLEQLKMGRCGLLLDLPSGQGPTAMPYISFYSTMRILNWDIGPVEFGRRKLNALILDETDNVRDASFSWRKRIIYRVCMLKGGDKAGASPAMGPYVVGLSQEGSAEVMNSNFKEVQLGGKTFDEIPFVFINTKDILAETDSPPLMGLSNMDLTIYRSEADYRQTLFMQSQETLVITGASSGGNTADAGSKRVGAGTIIELPTGADAKYIGVSSKALSEQRQSLTNDIDLAKQQGSRMLSTKGGDQQSGDALRTRVSAQTATLPSLAITRAFALEQILKMAARIKGADESKVKVTPNTDFIDEGLTGQDALNWQQSKNMGLPLSKRSIHTLLKRRGATDMSYDDEQNEIEGEGPSMPIIPGTQPRGVNLPPKAPAPKGSGGSK